MNIINNNNLEIERRRENYKNIDKNRIEQKEKERIRKLKKQLIDTG